ncbi:MAG: 30S ribosomal protein S8e [Candidatus Altiarchaeota archaeon]|nr:30S ribosomal protein S8e [Candidatus Altiarchaeota archaeon]
MAQFQGRKTKLKGRKKEKAELGADPRLTHLAHGADEKEARKTLSTKGGGKKTVLTKAKFANVSEGGKAKRVEIKTVVDNPANKDFKRMDIISKGAIVETELGKARVTSRASQDGVVNAVLLK